jgi:hypothetical protein
MNLKEAFPMALPDSRIALDHLLLGIADLDQGIAWVRQKTGVKAMIGGSHPGAGTRNALISLGNRQYLEIVSLDPSQNQAGRIAALIQNLQIPQVITWAASTRDINKLSQRARAASHEIEGPSSGERHKPDGGILKWRTVRIISRFADVIPFFIEWGPGVTHPSKDSPSGCRLEALEIEHPEDKELRKTLQEFGINVLVNQGNKPRLKAILSTPMGRVEL